MTRPLPHRSDHAVRVAAEWLNDDASVRDTRDEATGQKRTDIQGLRCIAVALVILFHAGVTRVSGGFIGVDVFFVISGFLITGTITRQLEVQRHEFSLLGFYANRARRLLPAAFVAIASTLLLTYLILPGTRYESTGKDAIAAAYYGINWRLSSQAVDYLAQNAAPSPLEHYWSLSVEEQFYLVWPLLLILALVVGRYYARRSFVIVVAVTFAASLAYSIMATASSPAQAYFVTPTRVWELALGGGLALGADHVRRLRVGVAATIGWVGLAAIGFSAVAYTGGTPFPGWQALVPTVGAAAVIATGERADRLGPASLLSLRPLVTIGDISYSLYLWHWPLIVFVAYQYGDTAPGWAGLAAGFGAIVPAYLSYRYIEQPVIVSGKEATPASGLQLGLTCSISAILAGLVLILVVPTVRSDITIDTATGRGQDAAGRDVKIGAEVLGKAEDGAPRNTAESILPDPVDAVRDIPDNGHCIALERASTDQPCTFGQVGAATKIALVGDSHAMQWLSGLTSQAKRYGWEIITHTKQSCPLTTQIVVSKEQAAYTECDRWNDSVTRDIIKEQPSLVLVSSEGYLSWSGRVDSTSTSVIKMTSGFRRAWSALRAAGIKAAVLADTPRPNFDIVGCVEQNRSKLTKCARSRASIVNTASSLERAARSAHLPYLDFTRYICPTKSCASVIGNVLVYRDGNHLTDTYVTTLGGHVGRAVDAALR